MQPTQHEQIECANQKAGGVVQKTAEAAHKVPLQEGGVLRGKLLGPVRQR